MWSSPSATVRLGMPLNAIALLRLYSNARSSASLRGAPLLCLVNSVPCFLRGLLSIVPGLLSFLLVRRNFFARNFALVC